MKKIIIILIVMLCISSCNKTVDIKKLEQELLSLHQETIQAHLNKDADFFIRDISDNYMQVHGGEFLYPKKEEIYDMFTHYLNSTEFTLYEDIASPIVKVSDDGSLGWTIVQVKVQGEQKSYNDSVHLLDFTCAWITLYEHENGKWIRLGEVDNFKIGD